MKIFSRFGFLLAAAGSLCCIGMAQGIDSSGLSVPQKCALLLRDGKVAAKLSLSSTQSAAITTAERSHSANVTKLNSDKKATDADWSDCDRKLANALLNTLTVPQKQAVLRIGLSQIGLEALADPDIAAKLDLNEIQLNKIQKIFVDYQKEAEDVSAMTAAAIEQIPVPKKDADKAAYEAKKQSTFDAYDAERQLLVHKKVVADNKAFNLLTSGQKDKWKDLGGPSPKTVSK